MEEQKADEEIDNNIAKLLSNLPKFQICNLRESFPSVCSFLETTDVPFEDTSLLTELESCLYNTTDRKNNIWNALKSVFEVTRSCIDDELTIESSEDEDTDTFSSDNDFSNMSGDISLSDTNETESEEDEEELELTSKTFLTKKGQIKLKEVKINLPSRPVIKQEEVSDEEKYASFEENHDDEDESEENDYYSHDMDNQVEEEEDIKVNTESSSPKYKVPVKSEHDFVEADVSSNDYENEDDLGENQNKIKKRKKSLSDDRSVKKVKYDTEPYDDKEKMLQSEDDDDESKSDTEEKSEYDDEDKSNLDYEGDDYEEYESETDKSCETENTFDEDEEESFTPDDVIKDHPAIQFLKFVKSYFKEITDDHIQILEDSVLSDGEYLQTGDRFDDNDFLNEGNSWKNEWDPDPPSVKLKNIGPSKFLLGPLTQRLATGFIEEGKPPMSDNPIEFPPEIPFSLKVLDERHKFMKSINVDPMALEESVKLKLQELGIMPEMEARTNEDDSNSAKNCKTELCKDLCDELKRAEASLKKIITRNFPLKVALLKLAKDEKKRQETWKLMENTNFKIKEMIKITSKCEKLSKEDKKKATALLKERKILVHRLEVLETLENDLCSLL